MKHVNCQHSQTSDSAGRPGKVTGQSLKANIVTSHSGSLEMCMNCDFS